MQTFLPYEGFENSAATLDYRRLGKQRVECLQLLNTLKELQANPQLKKGWVNHPALLMWKGYEHHLVIYGLRICEEWISRGYNDWKCYGPLGDMLQDQVWPVVDLPPWLGDERLHSSHRSALMYKHPEHYKHYWSDVAQLEYFWPVTKERQYEKVNNRIEI